MTEEQQNLVIDNMRLVYHLIKKYNYDEDYASIGMIGLIKGVKSFDSSKGYRLSTYLCACIDNEIRYSYRNTKNHRNTLSLEDCFVTENIKIIDCIPDASMNIEDNLIKKETYDRLNKAIMKLDEEERDIIISLYGLYGHERKKQVELANKYHYSQGYLSRLHKKIIEKLKRIMESDELDI